MKKLTLLAVAFLLMGGHLLNAQETEDTGTNERPVPTKSVALPKSMMEVGIDLGTMFIAGDLNPKLGFGGGIHVRKPLDYLFSLRADINYGAMEGEKTVVGSGPNDNFRTSSTNWLAGSLYAVMNLNGMRWDKPIRKTNMYILAGAGMNVLTTEWTVERGAPIPPTGKIENVYNTHIGFGAGMAFRLSNRMNIGLESTATSIFGPYADRVDGINFESDYPPTRSVLPDLLMFTSLKLNFNVGDLSKRSEPLYWINPMDMVLNELESAKEQRSEISLDDTDGDGVLDVLDQEKNTPAGAIVDTKGRTLDSDRDGVPDHLDREPFYTPRDGERVDDEGVVVNPTYGGVPGSVGAPAGVSEERVRELIDEALQNYQLTDSRTTVAEWFLPMIHFGIDSYTVKYADYGNLASIARMLKSNPDIRLVVAGFTDGTGTEAYNNNLSYLRAKAVIDHLVTNHGIGRGRLVLQWKGNMDSLVPLNSSFMNRRVEFRVAGAGDVEMDPPSNTGGY